MSEETAFTEKENQVFNHLFKLDVNEHVEKKKTGKTMLTYLSWAWAWAEIKKKFPAANYQVERFGESKKPYLNDEDLGYMVFTTVTIEGQTHEMWLPVMDGANKAMKSKPYTYKVAKWENGKRDGFTDKEVEQASMFDINKTIMRCLVKNLAMFGLGLYIYAGEDLPEVPVEPPKPASKTHIKVAKERIKALAETHGMEEEEALNLALGYIGVDIKRVEDMDNDEIGKLLNYLNSKK